MYIHTWRPEAALVLRKNLPPKNNCPDLASAAPRRIVAVKTIGGEYDIALTGRLNCSTPLIAASSSAAPFTFTKG